MSQIPSVFSRPAIWVLLSLSLATGLRAWALIEYQGCPWASSPAGDGEVYVRLAGALAEEFLPGPGQGQGLQDIFSTPGPFYPRLLSVFFRHSELQTWAIRLFQSLLGVASVALIYGITQRLFGSWAGVAAAFLASLYKPFLFYEMQIIPLSCTLFLGLLALFLLLRPNPLTLSLPGWTLAGLSWGLASSGSPRLLLFVPVLLLWFCRSVHAEVNGARARTVSWGRMVCFLAALAAMPTWTALKNRGVAGQLLFFPPTGMAFFCGNHDQATGGFSMPQEIMELSQRYEWNRSEAEIASGRKNMKPGDVSVYWWGRGLSFVSEDPSKAFHLWIRKCLMFFNGFQFPFLQDIRVEQGVLSFLKAPLLSSAFILPLAFAGTAWRVRRKDQMLLPLFILTQALGLSVFFFSDRHRLPAMPGFIILAGAAVKELVSLLRSRNERHLLTGWLAAVPGILLALLPLGKALDFSFVRTQYAEILMQHKAYEDAVRLLEENLSQRSRDPMAMNNLAFAIAQRVYDTGEGDLARAMALATDAMTVTRGAPWVADTYIWVLLLDMRLAEATPLLARYLALPNPSPGLWIRWAYLQMLQGNFTAAKNVIRDMLKDAPAPVREDGRLLLQKVIERERIMTSGAEQTSDSPGSEETTNSPEE